MSLFNTETFSTLPTPYVWPQWLLPRPLTSKTFQHQCPLMTGSTQWLGWNSPETKSDWRSLHIWARPHTKIYRSANALTAFVSDLSSISSWHWQSCENHVVCNSVPSWSKHHETSSRLSKDYVYLYTESTAPGSESLHPLKWSSWYMATLLLPQSWSQWMAPPSKLEMGVLPFTVPSIPIFMWVKQKMPWILPPEHLLNPSSSLQLSIVVLDHAVINF